MALLNKNESTAFPRQIAQILRQRICRGEYSQGSRLNSVRRMAEEFEVAPGTLLRALDILEQSGLICRCHGKGTFVSKQINAAEMPLTACFAFPEKTLRIPNKPEINALNSELYRGLLQGSIDNNIMPSISACCEDTVRIAYSLVVMAWQMRHKPPAIP